MTPAFLRKDFRIRFVLILGILALANYLINSSVIRVDLTKDKLYSLTEASKRIVVQLDRPVYIKGYFTQQLQAPYGMYEQMVKDILNEYQALSRGLLRYEFVDPTGNQELEAEAQRFGISIAQIEYRSSDQQEIKKAYMGLSFVYGDKQESIPFVKNPNAMEYEVSSILKKLISDAKSKKTIGFLAGHGEPDVLRPPMRPGEKNPIRDVIEQSYQITTVDMSEKKDIPETVDALVLFAPMYDLSKREQYEIDQFIMKGKPVGFFLPNHMGDMRQRQITPIYHDLDPMIENYGVKLSRKLIVDRKQNGQAQIPVQQGELVLQALVNYPLYPLATTFDSSSVIVRGLQAMILPFHQALELSDSVKNSSKVVARSLIQSADSSIVQKEGIPPMDPQALMDESMSQNETKGPFTMVYTLEGSFTSYFVNKPLPDEDGTLAGRKTINESPKTRIFVAGGAEFIRSSLETFINMVDWLAQDEDLIEIRSKQDTTPPLKVLEPQTKQLISVLNVAGIPMLFIFISLIRWSFRRRQNK